jgi:hypothetical protein
MRMPGFDNVMSVFKLLPKTNCRQCNDATCLAFAASVFQGRKPLADCPHLPPDVLERYGDKVARRKDPAAELEAALADLKRRIAACDLAAAARRIGAEFADGRLTLRTLGKNFSVDEAGNFFADIHVHHWIAVPVLNYILQSGGVEPSGNWVPLRELDGGKDWHRLYNQRCEKPLKQLADTYTDLFADLVDLFNGRRVENHYESDISLVLDPLPKLPILICYWKPEDGIESSLNIFFDDTAEKNLNIGSIYTLAVGLVVMFEKIALRHG